jgi:hypothetical protein
MRSFTCIAALALAVCPFAPETAYCQDNEIIVENRSDDPPPQRRPERRRRGWRNSPVVWGGVALVLLIAIPVGVYKTVAQMRACHVNQQRDKAPWERAIEQAERERSA